MASENKNMHVQVQPENEAGDDGFSVSHDLVWGAEFLKWLWFHCEIKKESFTLTRNGRVDVWFDNFIHLDRVPSAHPPAQSTDVISIKGGDPAHCQELLVALSSFKMLSQVKLGIQKEDLQWLLRLQAETLDLQGVQMPKMFKGRLEDRFYERIFLLESLQDILDELVAEFFEMHQDAGRWQNYQQSLQGLIGETSNIF